MGDLKLRLDRGELRVAVSEDGSKAIIGRSYEGVELDADELRWLLYAALPAAANEMER